MRQALHRLTIATHGKSLTNITRPVVDWVAGQKIATGLLTVWCRHTSASPGIWTQWTSIRKVKEGETTNDLFAFLTTEPNKLVAEYHPKAMQVILTTQAEIDQWMDAPCQKFWHCNDHCPTMRLSSWHGI